MLIQFNFENYKSFRDENSLDLSRVAPLNDYDLTFSTPEGDVLPVAAIFGANGGGKSNTIGAFRVMRDYVLNSFNFGGTSSESNDVFQTILLSKLTEPFCLDDVSVGKKSGFEVFFTRRQTPDKVYNYGFTADPQGVGEEWLNVKEAGSDEYAVVFYRNVETDETNFEGLPENVRANLLVSLERETLVVSLGAKLKIETLKDVFNWFQDSVVLSINSLDGLIYHVVDRMFLSDSGDELNALRTALTDYLAAFDDTVVDVRFEKAKDRWHNSEILIGRQIDKKRPYVYISLVDESDGTQKMLNLYGFLRRAIDRGAVVFVDELNARLHWQLQFSVLALFTCASVNRNGAQLIFTSHEPLLIDPKVLRADEIWFAQKLENVSSLYSTIEFKGDSKTYDDYLSGKFGALPVVKPLFGGRVLTIPKDVGNVRRFQNRRVAATR